MQTTSRMTARSRLAVLLSIVTLTLGAGACTGSADAEDDSSEASQDELVATFHQTSNIDLAKTSRILLVGDSDELGELPLFAATTRARRYSQLYPNEQIVLFVTKDVASPDVVRSGSTVVKQEPFGPNVALSDLSRLTTEKLVGALDRFSRIASIDFFGHSSPFGALLEASGSDRVLAPGMPGNIAVLKDNFARDANPYITLNGCNGGASVAAQLSKILELPVSGALTGTNFQVLMSDGRWYYNDEGFFPPNLTAVKRNDRTFGALPTLPTCVNGACVRMKPQDSPYRGVWADKQTGFQYGLNYYKFFCDFPDAAACSKGMAQSLFAWPSIKPIDKTSSDADIKDVLADFFCSGNKDATWFDTCKTNLFAAAASGAGFSPMKSSNDFSHECSFTGCEQKFRCKMVSGTPQKGTCVWVDPSCRDDQSAASCRLKNTKKQTTTTELKRYLEGVALLRQ